MLEQELISYLKTKENWATKEEVAKALNLPINYNSKTHDKCSAIWNIKNNINNNVEKYNCIIISNEKGDVKIPTDEELKTYLDKEFNRCVKKFDRYWKKVNALRKVGQGTINGEFYKITRKGILSNEN